MMHKTSTHAHSYAFKLLFTLSLILSSLSIKAQCCDYALNMNDSYGDGWNGGTLNVFINNSSVGLFSATGFGSVSHFQICDGDTLSLVYTAGDYENENSYQLYDPQSNLISAAGPTPATGTVFTGTMSCSTPAILGGNPCTAIAIDTGMCVTENNTGIQGSGINASCANFQGGDLWFTMLAPPSGHLGFETSNGSLTDTGLAIWTDTACTNLTYLGCDDDNGTGYYSMLTLSDLQPNQRIYIQVWGYGGATGSFDLCVSDLGKISVDSSELPLVLINTQGQQIVQDNKIDCLMDIKFNGLGNITHLNDAPNIYSGNIGIEIRGASSASYPQPPYGIETRTATGANNNVSILGMPAENDWVLLSNYNDRSLIRNSLAYSLFGEMGNYSVRTRLCEVLIDSTYKGIYVMSEKIKRDNNRVNISTLNPVDITGDELTGGYILQQNLWDASNSFQSNYSPIDHPTFDVHFLYEYPSPSAIVPAQKAYIAAYVDSLETALYSSNFGDANTGYRKYLDVKSFIDYFLINELSRNADGFKKSIFYHKNKNANGGKLKAGPVWDFDWAWKNLGHCSIYNNFSGAGWAHLVNDCPIDNHSTGWYVRMLQDSSFRNELRCTYDYYRQNVLDTTHIFAYIDSMRQVVQNAQVRHFQRWPLLGNSGPAPEIGAIATSYNAELDTLKSWIAVRLSWLDANMPGLCRPNGLDSTPSGSADSFTCFPNPADNYVQVQYTLEASSKVKVSLVNSLGAIVLSNNESYQDSGEHRVQFKTEHLPAGTYTLHFESNTSSLYKKLIIVK